MEQVVEMMNLSRWKPKTCLSSTAKYHGGCCVGDARSQGTSRHGISPGSLLYSSSAKDE